MSKASKKKFKKEVVNPIVQEAKKLPNRPGRTYAANMDNVVIEASFKLGSDKDEKGNYVQPHLREVEIFRVIDVGPLTKLNENYRSIKKNSHIVPAGIGKISVLELDEFGFIGTIKPHDILAIVK